MYVFNASFHSLKFSVNSELSKSYNNLGNKNKVSTIFMPRKRLSLWAGCPIWAEKGRGGAARKVKDRQTEDWKKWLVFLQLFVSCFPHLREFTERHFLCFIFFIIYLFIFFLFFIIIIFFFYETLKVILVTTACDPLDQHQETYSDCDAWQKFIWLFY